MKKEFNQEISSPLDFPFEIETGGTYTITVRASCQPGWRNQWWLKFKGFLEDILDLHLDDEDLRVEIDGIVFKKPQGKKGLFNSPAAFSGTKILGKTKTVIFLLHLTQGSHVIKFIPDGSPYLENLEISEQPIPIKFTTQLNARAENENYYAWYSFVLVDRSLFNLSINAQADVSREERDDDDLQILINGEAQKKPENRHPQSYFCGFSAKGKEETFTKELGLPKDIHYIELFADKTPLLKSIELTLSNEGLSQAKVVWDSVNLREEPKTTAKVLARLSKGETVEVLEKAIKGERPENERGLLLNSTRWHQVIYRQQVGYVYSEAVEIEGESAREIQELIVKLANQNNVNPEFALSLCECESKFFPYAVSYNEDYPELAFGLMQLTKQLIIDLNNQDKSFHSPVNNPFNLEENIRGGIAYFQYLFSLYKDDQERLRKTIAAYNAGPGRILMGEKLKLSSYDSETQRLVNCVESRLKQETFKKIISAAKVFSLILFISLGLGVGYFVSVSFFTPEVTEIQNLQQETAPDRHTLGRLMVDFDNNGIVEEILFSSVDNEYQGWSTRIVYQSNFVGMDGSLLFYSTTDVDNDGRKELVVKTTVGANGVITRVYKLTSQGLTPILLQPDLIPAGFFGDTSFIDYDNDGDLDVKVRIRAYPPDPCQEAFEIYIYNGGVFKLAQRLNVDEVNCRDAMRKFQG